MRIGIDAHALGSGLGGNETYLRGLLVELCEHPQHDYVLFVSDDFAGANARALLPAAKVVNLGRRSRVARLGWELRGKARGEGIDLLHVQYVAPIASPPFVVTIHDLSFRHSPEWYSRAEGLRFEMTVPWTARRARRVLTVSDFCRNDIARQLGLPADKIVVTPNRIGEEFVPQSQEPVAATCAALRIPTRYILTVGNLQPRKNLPRLVQAWELLRERGVALPLVIVGRKAWLCDATFAAAAQSRWRTDIHFTDYVAAEQLSALYSGAELFVYPSLFEGFGLPPLEAMACGAPVSVSNAAALPEICGSAAEYFDPHDPNAIADAMSRLLTDSDRRRELREAGWRQVEKFRRGDLGARTVAAYEQAAKLP